MSRDKSRVTRLMNGVTSAIAGGAIDVSDYRHVELQISSTGTAGFTIQFAISQSEQKPNFSAAASASNPWSYVQTKDLQNAATYNGTVGVVYTSDVITNLEVNTNLIKWLCPIITSYTQGAVNVDVTSANDSLQ